MKAIYAGSFDPMTLGHLDIIKRSMKLCKELVVAVGYNSAKKTMFTVEDRATLISKVIDSEIDFLTGTNIKVDIFEGLLVEYARQVGATILIRGVRSVADFEYEANLANINKSIASEIDTIFLPTRPELAIVSSSAVKEIFLLGRSPTRGDVSKFVPKAVLEELNKITPHA